MNAVPEYFDTSRALILDARSAKLATDAARKLIEKTAWTQGGLPKNRKTKEYTEVVAKVEAFCVVADDVLGICSRALFSAAIRSALIDHPRPDLARGREGLTMREVHDEWAHRVVHYVNHYLENHL